MPRLSAVALELRARTVVTCAAALAFVLALAPAVHARVPDGVPPRPAEKYSPWQSSTNSTFVSLATDAGVIYVRPRLTLGYGAPFWKFFGLDASWIVTNSFTSPAIGWRAALPFLNTTLGVRRSVAFYRRLLPPRASHTGDDLALDGGERSVYNAVDDEITAYAPVLHGSLFASGRPVWVDSPQSVHVFEEALRAVMQPPFALGLRGGYAYGFGKPPKLRIGALVEHIVLPGRPAGVWRSGPVALASISKEIEALFACSLVISSPDELGLMHGTYAFLGIVHRWAQRF